MARKCIKKLLVKFFNRQEFKGKVLRRKSLISSTNQQKRLDFLSKHIDTRLDFWKQCYLFMRISLIFLTVMAMENLEKKKKAQKLNKKIWHQLLHPMENVWSLMMASEISNFIHSGFRIEKYLDLPTRKWFGTYF